MKIFPFDSLPRADLIVDALYEGGASGGAADDPISRILPGAGNQGGFRAAGKGQTKSFIALYSSGEDTDWPDKLDPNTGEFTYYGDNKSPGHELHDTRRGGNKLLKDVFESLHGKDEPRIRIPPFFLFRKFPTEKSSRTVQFKGLAAPGFPGVSATQDLVAIWRVSEGQRFQNYRATFTILDAAVLRRTWLESLSLASAPKAWRDWVIAGKYVPLTAQPIVSIRTIQQQTPQTESERQVLRAVWDHFKDSPIAFEAFAARVFQMIDKRVIIDRVTRASIDGGRDAIGRYLLGLAEDPVYAEFALEAKCYRPSDAQQPNTIGVKETARLISRIRHREFGILVTTSVVARQAYEEVRADKHPIIFICGRDIAQILIEHSFNTPNQALKWLRREFPVSATSQA